MCAWLGGNARSWLRPGAMRHVQATCESSSQKHIGSPPSGCSTPGLPRGRRPTDKALRCGLALCAEKEKGLCVNKKKAGLGMGNMVLPVEDRAVEVRADGGLDWRFKLGQCISHKDQSMPSLVMGRVRTSKGREVYGVRSFMNVDPNRDRMISGERLVDVVPGSKPCLECLLHQTGMCPGEKR